MEDISERKKAEQAIRESEEKYRNILAGIEEGYFEVDGRGNPTFFNEAMSKILGYSAAELMVKNFREYTNPKTIRKILEITA
ncbi:MAG: PAS domain S-box protein [bacterium]|nr:PAS domain S-box protein [bacterium]